MMEKLTNLMRGCVRMEISGALPAGFLNRLARAGVTFWDADPADAYTLRLTIHAVDLPKARRAADRTLCTLEVLGRKGAPVLGRRLRRRRVLIACVLLCLLALGASQLFVWDITVQGNETVSTGEILRALEECGVGIGAFWPGFDADLLRSRMILKIPELSWLAVNVGSSRARVLVRERTEKPVTIDADAPANVTARVTGIVTRLSVLRGFPLVVPGDAVLAGETLVTGVMESPFGSTRYVYAMAEVQARTWYELTAEAPLVTLKKTAAGGGSSRWALEIGGARINFYLGSGKSAQNCDKIISLYPLSWDGVFTLPVTLVRERAVPYRTEETAADKAALRTKLEAELTDTLLRRLDGKGEIRTASFTAAETGGLLMVTLRAECLEDIAVTVPMSPDG